MTDTVYSPVVTGYSGLQGQTLADRYPSGSVEWLLDAVERQDVVEQDAHSPFEYLRAASGDPVVALVVQLVLEDRERHHDLLKRIEATLRDGANSTQSDGALPTDTSPQPPVTKALLDTANALIKEEDISAYYLRDIAHREKDVGCGLESLLIEAMAMDSDKHARLLQFVRDRLARRARGQSNHKQTE
jgi:hypothetical protein